VSRAPVLLAALYLAALLLCGVRLLVAALLRLRRLLSCGVLVATVLRWLLRALLWLLLRVLRLRHGVTSVGRMRALRVPTVKGVSSDAEGGVSGVSNARWKRRRR
jgi:hypothetical protein